MAEDVTRIPFDFGSARGNYVCRRHGDQEGGLIIRVDARPGKPAITRLFCGLCVIEALESVVPPMRVKD